VTMKRPMNTSKPVDKQILAMIRGHGRGFVFTASDCFALGTWPAIRQALSRLTRQGVIRRIGVSLYHYPRINESLGGEIPPAADVAALAVARKTDSRIVASGALAANVLGLSTQVPAKMVYLTNGPTRTITVDPHTLSFRHVSPRRMAANGKLSGIVFEALRYLRAASVTGDVIARLRRSLSGDAKAELKRDLPHAAGWMKPYIQQIIGKERK
jgi:hypothetical protein